MTRLFSAALLAPLLAAAQEVTLRSDGSYALTGVEAGASSDGWRRLLSVYSGVGDVPPQLGAYALEGTALVFRPRFAAAPGIETRAVVRMAGRPPREFTFAPSKSRAAGSAHVLNVYPTSGVLPANQLKLYIQFSHAMSKGEAWRHLRLLHEDGAAVDLPFLEIDQELWDRDYKRLTVLFDPGRIKRGVLPRDDVGPALEEGKSYTLAVSEKWLDAAGAPLIREFRKSFRVEGEVRAGIDLAKWRVSPPAAGTTSPLTVKFPRPLDWALLQRLVRVTGPNGDMDGRIETGAEETEWRFVPAAPWRPGSYSLLVDTALEDLAGNRVGRPFDVDTFDKISVRVKREIVSLPFDIRLE